MPSPAPRRADKPRASSCPDVAGFTADRFVLPSVAPWHHPAVIPSRRTPTASEEIHALHRALYRKQRQSILLAVRGYPNALRAYEARYRRFVRTYERPAPLAEIVRAALASDIVYVGDYHTLRQAQKAFLRLATECLGSGRRLVLALEFIQGRHQDALDRYLAGRLEEARFLKRIRYLEHQVFDVWSGFRPILELARSKGLDVVGIDSGARGDDALALRDEYAARRITQAALAPDSPLVLVLTGQLHVAPPHLPRCVSRALDDRGSQGKRALIVYQNCEVIYWTLAEAGLDARTEAVKIRDGEYCLVNTSPTVCQQSYLDWVENDGDAQQDGSGPEQTFRQAARLVAAFLGVDVEAQLSDVAVFGCGDLSFLRLLGSHRRFAARELASLKRQVLSRESFYLPRVRLAYLATLSVSHAGEEATHFVRDACAPGSMERPRTVEDAFYARIFEEAVGFFGSKLVNPRRTCAHRKKLVRMLTDPVSRGAAALALLHDQLARDRRFDEARGLARILDARTLNAAAHHLGYRLGDKLYHAVLAGRFDKREVHSLFHEPLETQGEAFSKVMDLERRVRAIRVPLSG